MCALQTVEEVTPRLHSRQVPCPRQIVQNRTIRSLVTVAAIHEVREGVFHRLEFFKLPVQEIQMLPSDSLNFAARASFVLPKTD